MHQGVFQINAATVRAIALVTQPENAAQIMEDIRGMLRGAGDSFRTAAGQTNDSQLQSAAHTYASAAGAAAAALTGLSSSDVGAGFEALALADYNEQGGALAAAYGLYRQRLHVLRRGW